MDYWFLFQNDTLWFFSANPFKPDPTSVAAITPFLLRTFHLGHINQVTCHCAEIKPDAPLLPNAQAVPFKQAFSLFEPHLYGIIVKAYSILNWDKNHQFCGRCGQNTTHPNAELYERVCTACQNLYYPRISPSIIVLIKKGDQILMARSAHFPPGAYGLIAGFVEPGETIEAAVHREVKEEVGIQIKDLRYFGSQPWPFPDSLMVAFTANYDSGEINIDPKEIEKAGWYTYDQLPGYPSFSKSIAFELIRDFLTQFDPIPIENRSI